MRYSRRRLVSFLSLALVASALLGSTGELAAQDTPRARGNWLGGDWTISMDFDGRSFESILSFSRDGEGKRSAEWISLMGITELKDVSFEDGRLRFVSERANRDGETVRSTFDGTIAEGKLTGVLKSDEGERKVEGVRAPRVPRAVGHWTLKFQLGEREITNTLDVKLEKDGKLGVDWKSERVTHEISEVSYERGKLSFKTHSKMDDRQWDSSFEGTIERNTLAGTIRSDRGEVAVEGSREELPIVGTWVLETESDRGSRKQRLRVHPDLSGLYGTVPIEKIQFEDGKVRFDTVLEFGEQKFELRFEGKLDGETLAGEMSSPRGARKMSGKKSADRRPRGRRQAPAETF